MSPELSLDTGGERAIRGVRSDGEVRTGTMDGRALAAILGWFSVALGAVELVASAKLTRAIGVMPSAATSGMVRAMGLRKVASGSRILSYPRSKESVSTRLGDDAADLALLSLALLRTKRPLRTLLATAAVIGVAALGMLLLEKNDGVGR